jgi:hypothetical protein
MSGVTKKTSKVKKTNENEGSGAADSVTKRKRNRKYLTTTNKTHLKALTTFFVTTTFLLHHATAEKYIGCLLNEDVCDDNETCLDDFAFGRCVSKDDDSNDDFYRFSDFSAEEEDFPENEMARLYDEGFVWTDDYFFLNVFSTILRTR